MNFCKKVFYCYLRCLTILSKTVEKSSATYSDSLCSKHSNTLQNIAKQGGGDSAQTKNGEGGIRTPGTGITRTTV